MDNSLSNSYFMVTASSVSSGARGKRSLAFIVFTSRKCIEQRVMFRWSLTNLKCGQAEKLSIDWLPQPVGQGMDRDLYDGKRLPSYAPFIKQLIPVSPTCLKKNMVSSALASLPGCTEQP